MSILLTSGSYAGSDSVRRNSYRCQRLVGGNSHPGAPAAAPGGLPSILGDVLACHRGEPGGKPRGPPAFSPWEQRSAPLLSFRPVPPPFLSRADDLCGVIAGRRPLETDGADLAGGVRSVCGIDRDLRFDATRASTAPLPG